MKYPKRLWTRLTLSFTLLFVLTFAVMAVATIYFADRAFSASPDDALVGIDETVLERLNRGETPAEAVDALSTASQFVQIVDLQGVPTARSFNLRAVLLTGYLPTKPTETTAFRTVTYRGARLRVARLPLFTNGALSGYVVAATPSETEESVQNLSAALVASGVFGLAFSVGGTVLLARRESMPLKNLAEAARKAATSGFEEPIPPVSSGSEEARELGRALSELVERQREVLRRERAFFADSSHVLRTPLAVLRGDIELLEQGTYGKEREVVLNQARSSLDTLSRTLQRLLLLAREDDGEPSWEVIDVSELLAAQIAAATTASPQLTVSGEVEPGLEVAGDPHQVIDLFTAVVENACRYTPQGGSVEIRARSEADGDERTVMVEVRDSGIGLSPEDIAHGAERFYRGKEARKRYPEGSGLGLSIAERIATLHNGSLSLEANPVGGACARVVLPLLG